MMSAARRLTRAALAGIPGLRPPTPPLLVFNVTRRCNLECRHCDSPNFNYCGDELTLDEILAVARDVAPLDGIGLGGGEPFLRRDLDEIAVAFGTISRARGISIPTNGWATDVVVAKTEAILARLPGSPLEVRVSLDGFAETHDRIRAKKGSFERAIATGRALAPLRLTHAGFRLTFGATINEENWRELPALGRWVREELGAELSFNLLSGDPRDATLRLPDSATTERVVADLCALHADDRRSASRVLRRLRVQASREGRFPIRCRAGAFAGLILANGDVHACSQRPRLGNLRDASFSEIWASPEAREQARQIWRGACRCSNDCFLMMSVPYSAGAAFAATSESIRRRAQGLLAQPS